ncbi:MAG: tetratricopeptide repeat protein, partial [Thermodesulfobacteriota bacterium]|nr:tetratricopeptide repeat protein [Thermodesulfobacteriota bacterium]
AFWHLKQKEPEKAGPFLARVLEKDEMDLEACLNMAIIELGSNHVAKARKRLALLRDRYPENSEIREILGRLK